jgi:hypothetical protein
LISVLSKSSIFYGQRDSMQRMFTNKCFLFLLGSVCHIKLFHLGGRYFAYDEEVEMEVWKWPRQQSKDFHAACFNALVQQWTSVSMLVEDMSRNKRLFQVRISRVLCFTSIYDVFTDSCFVESNWASIFIFMVFKCLSNKLTFSAKTRHWYVPFSCSHSWFSFVFLMTCLKTVVINHGHY